MNKQTAKTCKRVVELWEAGQGIALYDQELKELQRLKKRISYRNLLDYLCNYYEIGEAKRIADEIK